MTADAALARCVGRSARSFAEGNWGRAPLLSRAAELPAPFADLFSAAAVDELVSERGLRTPFLRMAKDGAVRPAGTYTRGGGAGAGIKDQAADDKVLAALADGATLVLQGLHRTWPPLVAFGSALAEELGHPVQINAYITPPQSQGFAAHHDVHDVFVLQIAGRKHWTIHEPVVTDPLSNQSFDAFTDEIAARVAEAPVIDTVLAPGDALYLPRGTVHSAEALGETSIHLTVGVHPLTRYDLVRALLDAVQDDPGLRASLPVLEDLSDPGVLAPHLEQTVSLLRAALADVAPDRVAYAIGSELMQRTRPQAAGPLAQLAAAEALEPDTPLRPRPGLRLRARGGTLAWLDRTLELDQDVIAMLVSGKVFTPADLPADDGLELARRLLRETLIVPA